MTSFVRLTTSIKLIIEKFIIFMLTIAADVVFARTTQNIIILNNIIFLMFEIFFIIKSLFFNTEISIVKSYITLSYLSSKDNFLSNSFRQILKTLTF